MSVMSKVEATQKDCEVVLDGRLGCCWGMYCSRSWH